MTAVEIERGVTIDVTKKKAEKGEFYVPKTSLQKKQKLEKKVCKSKNPPIPQFFKPLGPPSFVQDKPDALPGVRYHKNKLKLRRAGCMGDRKFDRLHLAPAPLDNTHPQTPRTYQMYKLFTKR